MLNLRSRRFGWLQAQQELSKDETKFYITVWMKTPEQLYRFYPRNFDNMDTWSNKEVDWRGYLLGAKSLRLDYEYPVDPWGGWTNEQKLEALEIAIQRDFDNDDLHSYHVEPVRMPKEWITMTDEQLCELERQLHKRKFDLENELRDTNRLYSRIWLYGDEKFNWSDRL